MTTASDVAETIVSAETDATVAAAAAQTAVVAADAAVIMAEVQTAQVVAAAAAEINENANEVSRLTEEVLWLRNALTQTQATLETQNLATLASMSEFQATLALLTQSAASPSPTPPVSEELNPAVQVINPSEAVVVQQEAQQEAAPSQKPALRLKRL